MHTLKTITLALMLVIFSVSALLTPTFVKIANAGENAKYRLRLLLFLNIRPVM